MSSGALLSFMDVCVTAVSLEEQRVNMHEYCSYMLVGVTVSTAGVSTDPLSPHCAN